MTLLNAQRFLSIFALAFGMGLASVSGSVWAQAADSTSLSAGAPPLPTGIWDASSSASNLASQITTLNTNNITTNSTVTSVANTANAAYSTANSAYSLASSAQSTASAAAANGGSVTVSIIQSGDSNQGTTTTTGLCSSQDNPYYYNGFSESPSTPGTGYCPASMPYYYSLGSVFVSGNYGE